MNLKGDEYGEIVDIVSRLTRFFKSYLGEVVDDQDELKRGRVRVSVPELGWVRHTESPWVEPEYGQSFSTPRVGSWVVVYFMAGNPSRPFYRGRPGEVQGTPPSQYAEVKDVVLLDEDGVTITYDREEKSLTVSGADLIRLNGEGDSLVLHSKLDSDLQNFKSSIESSIASAISGHTHICASSGSTSAAGVGSASPTSLDISSSATETIKAE